MMGEESTARNVWRPKPWPGESTVPLDLEAYSDNPWIPGIAKTRGKWYPYPYPLPVRYEYKCPHCGKVNVRFQETRRLVCDYCGRGFWA